MEGMNTIVIGSLNTDLVATGIKKFPKPGEHVYGKELVIGPAGKSRNIADMIARLMPKDSVSMVGRTVKDSYGLWKPPVDSLVEAGVNIDYIVMTESNDKLPGIALIPVDTSGNNQIIVLPGVSDDFSTSDIDQASPVFDEVSENNGTLVLTLECPLVTAIHAVKLANKKGLKVMFDPGGLQKDMAIDELIKSGIYLIKPNEHETKILTGIDVVDFKSAKQAGDLLKQKGVQNVLITVGEKGAYLFTDTNKLHIPIPSIKAGSEKDETGCGDQTMATLCAFAGSKTLEQATKLAIAAGTLQFYRLGIKPIILEDLENFNQ